MKRKGYLFFATMAAVIAATAAPVFADRTAVAIEAPDTAKKGQSVVIRVNVTHKGNNFIHHTNWVYVKAEGKEIARWEFSSGKLPEGEVFSRDISLMVTAPVEVTAEGNCTIHGSRGVVTKKIAVK
ncbi:MAG TPA: desulfoferrodoxin family protein [Spirochaetota bacterium]|nr:desulfoferrodoxin family protein [Spirochaetota bacterium]